MYNKFNQKEIIRKDLKLPTRNIVSQNNKRYLPHDLNFYQCTCVDEATKERFLYWHEEHIPENTVNFVKRCIEYFSYAPKEIQTDNDIEFTCNRADVKKIQYLWLF